MLLVTNGEPLGEPNYNSAKPSYTKTKPHYNIAKPR